MTDLLASGSSDGFLRFWKAEQNGRLRALATTPPVIGFLNALEFSKSRKFLAVGIGQEPRLGRWDKVQLARNGVQLFKLPEGKTNSAARAAKPEKEHQEAEVEKKWRDPHMGLASSLSSLKSPLLEREERVARSSYGSEVIRKVRMEEHDSDEEEENGSVKAQVKGAVDESAGTGGVAESDEEDNNERCSLGSQ
eukprot:gb/GEZN01014303.1/.p2 GENE.gb/GEZN01014303.1/~~gb/GEZN01014303.1/.p2  ORF type:complete len:194 (+),score=36.39 gb/GEZN01014303.1/:353-934(+)